MDHFARLPVGIRRRIYRLAYAVLCVYWFLFRPRAEGVKCVLTHGDRVLLVRHTYGPDDWELPGGALKAREAPLHAARREMQEELGVAIDDWTGLGAVTGQIMHRRDTVHCFHAELNDRTLSLDLGELRCAEWFARAELPSDVGSYVHPVLDRLPAT